MVNVSKNWKRLLAISSIILGASSSFLVTPAAISVQSRPQAIAAFNSFLVAVISAIALYVFSKLDRKKQPHRVHLWICLTSILLSAVCFLTYDELMGTWTTPYGGRRLIVGENADLQPAFWESFRQNLGVTSNEKALDPAIAFEKSEGESLVIWKKESILTRRRTLYVLYLLSSTCTSLALLSATHLLPNDPTKRK
jgi:hypothetical protein